MSDHVLLQFAKRRPYADRPQMPADARYDFDAAQWFVGERPMIDSNNPPETTKKCDQETGEDQKGE
jgi:hypothetical protein